MIRVYTQPSLGHSWIEHFCHKPAGFACVLGFTDTGLIPGISAAGATPQDRAYTAIADAEFLYSGPQAHPAFPLPPLVAGASPVLISRAVVSALALPVVLFDAGLRHPATVPCIDVQGRPAQCVSTGAALPAAIVEHLFQQGLLWGEKLATDHGDGYIIVSECVVGGTTTALGVLTGLGCAAHGKVNSSHPTCNHQQKWELVVAGLTQAGLWPCNPSPFCADPLQVVAAVGDPMQPVVAGMAIAASRRCGVLLAGGTQMLAVYALMQALSRDRAYGWNGEQVVVGTTRWVAEDPTGDTVGLADLLQAPLLATSLSFADSRFAALRAYEQGYVKEGVGAGGCAIAAELHGWPPSQLLHAIEHLWEQRLQLSSGEEAS